MLMSFLPTGLVKAAGERSTVLPIILSIVLITWGVGFGLTAWITTGMLASVIVLLYWDADRIWAAAKIVLGRRHGPSLLANAAMMERAGWVLGGGAGLALFLTTRSFLPSALVKPVFVAGGMAAVLMVAGWIRVYVGYRKRSSTA